MKHEKEFWTDPAAAGSAIKGAMDRNSRRNGGMLLKDLDPWISARDLFQSFTLRLSA
jgi:hypothetical protein